MRMKMKPRSYARPALSLVEALLAAVFLAIAYLPLAQLFHETSQETIKSRNHLVAQHLATNLFEIYRVKADDILQALSGTDTMTTENLLSSDELRDLLSGGAQEVRDLVLFSRFKMKVEVTRGVGGLLGLDRLVATLEWQEDGHPRSHTYARIVGK
jgi:hypothetical protein